MKSLRRRLTVTHTLVGLLAVLLMATLASGLIVRAYGRLAAQQAQSGRQAVANSLAQYYTRNRGWDGVADVLQQRLDTQPLSGRRRVIVADAGWRVLFDSQGVLNGQPMLLRFRAQSDDIVVRGQTVGHVAIPIGGRDANDQDRAFRDAIVQIVLIGSVATAAVALLVALLLARRLTTPLRSLTLAAHRLAAGERHQPLSPPADAELAELATAFNSMAAELDRQQDLRRQLVADIAHELRTPISVLRMQIEAVQDGVEPSTSSVFASLGEEVSLLTRLVEDLRLLSLADAGQLAFAVGPLDPRAALERAAAAVLPRARQQGVAVQVEPGAPLPNVLADPQRLAQVLGNLLDNALRYTPAGGRIVLSATPDTDRIQEPRTKNQEPLSQPAGSRFLVLGSAPSSIILSISDTGPGIAHDDLPHVFDRFYRADHARSRETGGSGLGLAIVQRLVEAQNGQVRVSSVPGQGTTFRIALPVAEEDDGRWTNDERTGEPENPIVKRKT